jgi:hypothetical protein
MDRYRIEYKCNKIPKPNTGLEGFTTDRLYIGRAFNGLFEVAPNWGSGRQTKLIERTVFQEYFEIVSSPVTAGSPINQ